ncbi:MAG: glycosyltransferase [Nostoc sp. DedVER02]|uniref:glycosyltransferase family protein n=1 Tax=unclassified Nostoc TaxID=2593658 RepID=UPI002AD36E72|nr:MULTISPECIES: glycosyltransferase [unclassified Nostoc]MDZ7988012.1 glycosyltransferase [Nostoc sp. DedVER02]MDZ8114937.1 glycosyltransferase [Nostoc sp. DedVER01b]
MLENREQKKFFVSRILYIQYTNPGGYPPLEQSSTILAQAGWEIQFLGIEVFGASALCFPSHPQIAVQLMPFCSSGWRQKLHYLQFFVWVLILTLRWQPQWIYASDLLSCPVTLLLSFLPNIKVVYHEHDSPNTTAESWFIRFCLNTRKWLASRAKICILPNQQRLEQFSSDTGVKHNLFCVWNCPAQTDAIPRRLSASEDGLQILYHGSIVPSRLPIAVLKALAMLPANVKLRVIGYDTIGHQSYTQELQEIAKELGIDSRVNCVAAMPRYELLKWCRECDVGLAFMPINANDINQQRMVGASNKPFDYLACGLALLVSDLPEWNKIYVEPGYGLACNPDDPESIAASFKWYLEHPVERQEMGDRGRQRIFNDWNYQQQFMKVSDRLCQY